jgi:hypothetical protein
MLAYEWRVFLPKSPGHRELRPKYRLGLKELRFILRPAITFCTPVLVERDLSSEWIL